MRKQVFNPYLPLDTYIPDGEPHVFGDRLYIYGSHDQEGGSAFCLLDYEVWSAPVTDLSVWRCEGISYRASDDPAYGKPNKAMYAPDVVQGTDGRFYLYYAMAGETFTSPIHVAVSDDPEGPFAYYGEVHNPDGSAYDRHVTFDPGVMNDGGRIYLYYGWSLGVPEEKLSGMLAMSGGADSPAFREKLLQTQMMLFGKAREEVEREKDGLMGADVVQLAEDMLTVITEPKRILPGQFDSIGTEFEHHAFFEASSMRKINGTYYFIYSSQVSHELCYAVSRYPDRDFHYGGVIISNGDIGYQGRKEADRLAMTGNNHGSLVCVEGQWYIFYHRQTHKTAYSRQGCAEKVMIAPDGSIAQVEMTSCGLNEGPLLAKGSYPAPIACNITNGRMPHAENQRTEELVPHITHEHDTRYIAEITEHTEIAYKYFAFSGETPLTLCIRGTAAGDITVFAGEKELTVIPVLPSEDWKQIHAVIDIQGTYALRFLYNGPGVLELKEFSFDR